ncbi:MAG: DUF4421 family protein [Paludibacteraceae bacterium]|nr:DUF4421 family protein [Paludibacteraceae bacterium]
MLQGVDTNYITLPEHSWRLAYTNATVGVNSMITSTEEVSGGDQIYYGLGYRSTPSVDLGFNVGYRGFGFGYSWDALHAYAQRLSFSLGSKFIGIDFSIQTSTNLRTTLHVGDIAQMPVNANNAVITNANLSIWYALNSPRYSHQAAVKQSYIQRKTAGSPLLFLSYMSSQVQLGDSLKLGNEYSSASTPALMSGVTALRTRQIAVGIGYGINYTPNKGKVILHASAAALLVTYSVNLVSFSLPDSVAEGLPDEPMYNLNPSYPVHVTGNMRAAVSWEINKWVHLSAWATADHIRFRSNWTANDNYLSLKNWNWKVQLTIGVRLGAGYDRVQRALIEYDIPPIPMQEKRQSKLPQWVLEYFYSPKL